MTTRSTRAALAKLLAVLMAFTLVAGACGDDGGDDAETEEPTEGAEDDIIAGEASGEGDLGGGEEEDETEEEVDPTTGGTLRIGIEAESDGLNPTANNFAISAYLMGDTVFEPLFYIDEEGDWFPWLAESAEPIGDGSTWEIKLREGITFHDGTPLNAEALVANFESAITDPIISLAIIPSYPAENRYEIVDDLTVRYNLVRPTAHYPVNLTSQLGMIASPEWLAAAAENEALNQEPVGTGPFKIDQRDLDRLTRVVRNDDYWQGTEDIYLDAIEFYITTDTAVAAEQLGTDELDMVVTSNADATITAERVEGVSTQQNLLGEEEFVMMNTNEPPFDDIRARQALTFATDREGYIELIGQGTRVPADSMYHPDLIWNNPDVVQEANLPDQAAPLVAEYCGEFPENCTDGRINTEFQYSGPSTLQTRIKDLLIGGWSDYFNVTEDLLPQDQHITQVATGQWNAVTWRQFGQIDPDNEVVWLQCETATGLIALNWPRWCNEERDALLFEGRATDDQDRRVEIMQEVQQEMNEAYTYVFLTHSNWTTAIQDDVRDLCNQTGPEDVALPCNVSGRSFLHSVWLENG